jgi:hypothetical protein
MRSEKNLLRVAVGRAMFDAKFHAGMEEIPLVLTASWTEYCNKDETPY